MAQKIVHIKTRLCHARFEVIVCMHFTGFGYFKMQIIMEKDTYSVCLGLPICRGHGHLTLLVSCKGTGMAEFMRKGRKPFCIVELIANIDFISFWREVAA